MGVLPASEMASYTAMGELSLDGGRGRTQHADDVVYIPGWLGWSRVSRLSGLRPKAVDVCRCRERQRIAISGGSRNGFGSLHGSADREGVSYLRSDGPSRPVIHLVG
jgi:hypothetical protein